MYSKNKISLILLALIIPVFSCDTDHLHELNINPQVSNEMDMNFLFTAAELGIASGGSSGNNRYIDWRTNIIFCAAAIQQLANSYSNQISAGDKYLDNSEVYSGPWDFWYSDVLKNCAEIIKQTGKGGFQEGEKKNTREAARIIQAFTFARLTDFYGNIPYSEANRGIEGYFSPKFEKQSDIYPDILKELDEATAAISTSNRDDGFAYADFIFNGDIIQWKRWGYSLMLRYGMRISNVDPTLADQYVTKALAGGVLQSNEDNVWVPQADGPGVYVNQNGISRAFYPGDGGATQNQFLSKTIIDFLKGKDPGIATDDDPRLMILSGGIGDWNTLGYFPVDGGTDPLNQTGMPNGHDHYELAALLGLPGDYIETHTFSLVNPELLYKAAPYGIMNCAETEFLQAEACEKSIGGLSPSDAQTHYNKGVKAAMQMYTVFDPSLAVSDAAVDAYLALYPYGGGGISGSESKLKQIGWQMWASHFFNWYEAWNYWRRTGYPKLTPTNYQGNLTNGQIPRRLRYPTSEVKLNLNFEDGATLPNDLMTKVWWDGGAE